jgi:hypothetical protein
MTILNSTNTIHITVGAGLVHGLDLTHELRLLKAALLYGDKVKLCSIASSTLITLLPLCCLRDDELLEFIPDWGEALGLSQDELATTAEHYKHLRHKKRRNKQELLAYTQVKYGLEQYKIDLKAKVEEIAINAGAEGLLSALETGLIEVQIFRLGADNTAIVNEFFNSIKDAILSGHTYPLFDDSAGQLVNAAIKEGKLVPLNTSASRAKQVGLSSNLLNRLPLFDNASVDEIVDIRKELDKPLVHFRSAIIKFSKEIESSSWEREFPQEVEQVFH